MKNREIPVQVLYVLRQKHGFCSGTELHDFFYKHFGVPSPSGNKKINMEIAKSFFMGRCTIIEHNSSTLFEAMKMARAEWGRMTELNSKKCWLA